MFLMIRLQCKFAVAIFLRWRSLLTFLSATEQNLLSVQQKGIKGTAVSFFSVFFEREKAFKEES